MTHKRSKQAKRNRTHRTKKHATNKRVLTGGGKGNVTIPVTVPKGRIEGFGPKPVTVPEGRIIGTGFNQQTNGPAQLLKGNNFVMQEGTIPLPEALQKFGPNMEAPKSIANAARRFPKPSYA